MKNETFLLVWSHFKPFTHCCCKLASVANYVFFCVIFMPQKLQWRNFFWQISCLSILFSCPVTLRHNLKYSEFPQIAKLPRSVVYISFWTKLSTSTYEVWTFLSKYKVHWVRSDEVDVEAQGSKWSIAIHLTSRCQTCYHYNTTGLR